MMNIVNYKNRLLKYSSYSHSILKLSEIVYDYVNKCDHKNINNILRLHSEGHLILYAIIFLFISKLYEDEPLNLHAYSKLAGIKRTNIVLYEKEFFNYYLTNSSTINKLLFTSFATSN